MLTGPFDFLPVLLSLSLPLLLVLNCRIDDIASTVDDKDSIIVAGEAPAAAVAADRETFAALRCIVVFGKRRIIVLSPVTGSFSDKQSQAKTEFQKSCLWLFVLGG